MVNHVACFPGSLRTNTNDAQTLVDQDSVVSSVVAAPIGTTMADLLSHAQGSGLELLHIGMAIKWSASELRGTRSELSVEILRHTCGKQKYHTSWAMDWYVEEG